MSAAAAETFLEELLELCVENGVDDGIEGAVDITQPGEGARQRVGNVAFQAKSFQRVHHEEWRPTQQEAACKRERRGKVRGNIM